MRSIFSQAENEWFNLNSAAGCITIAAVLHALGIVTDPEHANFTFEDDKEERFTIDLQPMTAGGSVNLNGLHGTSEPALYRQKPDEPFWSTYLEDTQAIYVGLRGCSGLWENEPHSIKKGTCSSSQGIELFPPPWRTPSPSENSWGRFSSVSRWEKGPTAARRERS